MKRAKIIGKKTLSVFLAVLMVLTAWVWVAPTKAEAAEETTDVGNYYVTVNVRIYDYENDFKNKYATNEDGTPSVTKTAGFSLFYKDSNGTGTEKHVPQDLYEVINSKTDERSSLGDLTSDNWSADDENSTKYDLFTYTFPNVGFPTKLTWVIDSDAWTAKASYVISKITVAASKDATQYVLWEGACGGESINNSYSGVISPTETSSTWKENKVAFNKGGTWTYPYAKTVTWTPTSLSAETCPKGDAVITKNVSVVAKDQYGVQLFNPTWSISSNKNGSAGLSLSKTSASASNTIKITSAANTTSASDTSQTVTVKAKWDGAGTDITKQLSFILTDAKYKATFSYKVQESEFASKDTSEEIEGYHGITITAPTIPEYYSQDDRDYYFEKWQPDFSQTLVADVDYVAKYDTKGVFIPADYTIVENAKAEVQKAKDELGLAKFNAKYTVESQAALETAINSVDYDLGRTNQAKVDEYAEKILEALKALEDNTFAVIFLDKNGAILKYEKGAKFETSVAAPTFPEDQKSYYDAENHYTYTGWDTDEYTSVTDDLVIAPTYTAEAHDWEIETVSSTCVQAGTQKYTCKVCGYVKYDGGDQLGDHVWNTDYTVDLEPTCTVAGSKSIHCKLCDAQKDITVIDPVGHQWGTYSVAVEATCGKIGISTRVCEVPECKVCEHLVIDALEHDYKKTVVDPTCTAKGYDEYVCQRANCGHSYRDNFTDVVAHTYGAWETVSDALCEVAGVKKQTCTDCGYINLGSIDALEHDSLDSLSWNVIVPQTCTGTGYQTKTCSKCKNVIATETTDKLGHNYAEKTVVAPTCTSKGYTIEECTRTDCGAQRIVNETPTKNHAWTHIEHEADCTHSKYIEHICTNDSAHNYIEYVSGSNVKSHTWVETDRTKATCTVDGSIKYECSVCKATKEEIIPKLGHDWNGWVKVDATNDADGSWTRTCKNDEKHIETVVIPKGGHNLVEDTTKYTAPQCNAKGQRVYKCTAHTDCSITVTVELDFAQHTIDQKVTDATCTTKGKVEAYCTTCDKECANPFSTEEIPVKAHTPEYKSTTAPTCTQSGYKTYACSCGTFSYNEYDASKPALGHNYVGTVTKVADCTNEGEMTYTCQNNNSHKYTETIPAIGHSYDAGTVVQQQSCTNVEKTEYNCDCGEKYTVITKEAKGHTYGDWTVVTPATADKNGVQKRTCSVCGTVEYDLIAPIGAHKFKETVTKEPTCTEKGVKSFTCTEHPNCSANYKSDIPATGHTQKIEYTAPTCVAVGYSKVICSVESCKAEILSETIPAIAYHDFSGAGVVTTEPTCAKAGEMTYTCATKDCTATKKETVPAKGHVLTTVVKDATCGVAGSVETTCVNCDDPAVEKTTVLTAKGHIWNDTPASTVDAKCETDGSKTYKCQYCNETNVVVVPKLGHDWGEWTVVQATNGNPGSVSRTCSRGCTESVEIPAGEHILTETGRTNSTCKTEGSVTYECKVAHKDRACGIKVDVTLPLAQHTVTQKITEATCVDEGKIEAYCTVCDKVFSTKTIPVKAHTYTAGTPVAPTCTTSGYTPYTCSNNKCNDTYNVYDGNNPAKGHDFDEKIEANVTTTPATCTKDGEKVIKCANCDVKDKTVLPKTGHTYVKGETTTADCTTAGTEVYTCACGDTYTKFIEKAKGHSWSNTWTVVRAATDNESGVEKTTCTVCDAENFRTTAPIGKHDFTETITTAATCTTDGLKTFTCKEHTPCAANYTEPIPATGHTQKLVYTAPTCIADGSSKVVCSVESCKAVIMSEKISATGCHDFSDAGVKTDATCTSDGVMTYTCKTDGCNAKKTETIPAKGHSFSTTVTDATCYKKGSVVTVCTACKSDSVKTEKVLPVIEHTWNSGAIAENEKATCEADGKTTYTCTIENCGATKTEVISKLGHNWGAWVKVDATNDTDGSWTRTCKNDTKHTETVVIPKGDHQWDDGTVTKEASCTETGTKVYKCKTHTGDAACGVTITITLDKLQHEFETTKTDATCEGTGSVVTKCKYCNTATITTVIPAKGHAYNTVEVTKPATCVDNGVRTYKCACSDTKTEEIPATGHKITAITTPATCTTPGSVVEDCSVCNYSETVKTLPAMGHDFTGTESDIKNPTCNADGSKKVKCSRCEETTTVILPKLGHTWQAWEVVTEATNTTDGKWKRTCSNGTCTDEITIPAGGHTWDDGTVTKEPSCAENGTGTMVYKCNNPAHKDCGITIEVTIPVKQHTVVQKETEATCTKEGSVEAYCEACGKVLSTEEIPVKAHSYDTKTEFAPTCTTSGYTKYTCSCGDTYNVYDETKPATSHKLVEGTSTADCTTAGEMTLTCENCTYSTKVNVPALGHNYVENTDKATDATCAAAETKTYECSRCDASYTISVGDKLTNDEAHKWKAWTVKESATASSLGYETRTCDVCGKTEVRTIAATGTHNFTIIVPEESKAPTCTEVGYETKRCSYHENCTATSKIELPATGHTEKHEYKAATCTETGYSRMVCAVGTCEEVLSTETIPALGHLYGEGTVTNATCKETGKIEYTCTRDKCSATHTVTIPTNINAHQYSTVVTDATCYKEGSVVTKCSLCDDETTNKVLPMIEHTWNSGAIAENEKATCEADGIKRFTCTVDGCTATKTEVVPKLGHNWGAWVKVDATNDTDGSWTRTCKNDAKHTETVVIPKGDHQWDDGTVTKEASCTETGTKVYKCKTHTGDAACGITITITLDMLQHELETTKTDATCEGTGSVVTKCKNCNTATYITEIPATGHTYNDGVKTDATCEKEGKIVYTCAAEKCGKTKEVTLTKLQHSYDVEKKVDATCTSSAYTQYKCTTCESRYVINNAPANGHEYDIFESSTATCTEKGVMTLKCACGVTMTTDVPALGHNYELKSSIDATCAAAKTETYECSRSECNASYTVAVSPKTTAHVWNDWVVVEKATNTSLGYQTRTCKVCEKLEVETIKATGDHNFTIKNDAESKAPTCTEDGYDILMCSAHDNCTEKSKVPVSKLGHTEELRYSAATCTQEGSTSIYCTTCDKTISSIETIAAPGHAWDESDISVVNATCKDKGEISLKCKNCSETKKVEIPSKSDAHKLKTTIVMATCKTQGSVTVTCENGCTYNEVTVIPVLQHNWSEWKKTDATNDTDGLWKRTCSNGCTEELVIPKGGHNLVEDTAAYKAPSCTTEGERVYKCTNHTDCTVTVTVKLNVVQHTLVVNSEASSCTKAGYVKVTCSECKKVYTDMTFGKLAHDYEVVKEVAETCTTAGYTTFKCKNCTEGYSRIDAQPTGHNFDDTIEANVKIVPATCDTDGSKTVKCQNCDATEVTVIKALGHTYSSSVTDPTCEDAGYTTFTCNCGDTYISNPVPATGHAWTEWSVTKEATNSVKGTLSRSCENGCGKTETAEIPAGGHRFDTTKPEGTTEGTCQTKGTKTFKCTAHIGEKACGVEITVETEYGAHAWSTWTKVDATNDTDGSWTRKCNTCKTVETLVIPKGEHKFGNTPDSTTSASCDHTGTATYNCKAHENCGITITVTLEKIQHTHKTDTKAATCTEKGFVKTYCTVCNEVFSNVEINATGHTDTRTETNESTCLVKGSEKVICNKCDATVSEKQLPLREHNFDKNGDGKVNKDDAVYKDGEYTYTCQYADCKHTVNEEADDIYKVRFFDASGKQYGETQTVKHGQAAKAPAKSPAKAADENYHYTFAAWDRNFSSITSDLDIYPTYEKEAHYGGEATCMDKAVCEICNSAYGSADESKHQMAIKVVSPATCEKTGELKHYCTVNGCTYSYSDVIEASGHRFGAWEVYQNGNCATPYIKIRKCQNFGCDKYEQTESYGAHTWYTQPEVPPTCTTEGYSAYKYCTTCGVEIHPVVIDKLPHKDLNGDGKCDYCTFTQTVPVSCSCMCHSTGFMKIIYAIVRFFWKLSGSSPVCGCGIKHY